jgi:hypothetical protein
MTTLLTSANIIHRAGAQGLHAVRLSAYFVAAALIATATAGSAGKSTAPERPPDASAQSPMVGVFTGEFVNGVPVYRLPPITVVGYRESELARMPRKQDLARARQGQARASARVLAHLPPTR